MRAVRVVKFGGSSFLDLADYRAVAAHLRELAEFGGVVAVVSGMSGTTGRLLESALDIDPDLEPAVQDQLLATAEMVGAGFLRAALHAQGCSAIELCGQQIGIRSDNTSTRARILAVDPDPVRAALARHRVVVVAGGQAVDDDGRVTMLGRNSSDLTAVALAAALGAPACEIVSDVPGVYSADPYVVPSARLLPELSYAQCAAMSRSGAKVLHWGSVDVAQAHGVRIVCRSMSNDPGDGGTVVGAGAGLTAVVGDRRAQLFRLAGSGAEPVVRALRETGLVVGRVSGQPSILAFPGGQHGIERALARSGHGAERLDGVGLVSVVTADGHADRRAVPVGDVDRTVRESHDQLHGTAVDRGAGGAGLARKRRSAHSGLLAGASVGAGATAERSRP